jgi:hypothetical protein
VTIVPVDVRAQVRSSGVVEKLGVHVVADMPVMVYGGSHRFQTTDSYLAYPVELLGRSYRTVCYRWLQNDLLAQVAIVATEDDTRVRIAPSVPVARIVPAPLPAPVAEPVIPPAEEKPSRSGAKLSQKKSKSGRSAPDDGISVRVAVEVHPALKVSEKRSSSTPSMILLPPRPLGAADSAVRASGRSEREGTDPMARSVSSPASKGESVEITLNRGEVYQIIAKYNPNTLSDLTGSLVESDKPVAVFSGHNCAYVPDPSIKACNLLVEQMPPISTWGREYYVGTFSSRSSSVVRVVASEEGTHVVENGREVAVLAPGQFYENRDQRAPLAIMADHPVLVVQFSKGFDNGDNLGDPMMMVIAPVSQYNSSYRFATPLSGSWHNFVNVVVPSAALGELRLDGVVVRDVRFGAVGDGWSSGAIEVGEGVHTITCTVPFGLSCYGFGYDDAAYDAYGNAGGYMVEHPAR